MYVVTVFLCLAQKINLFTMYHNGDTNDDDYIDTDDNGMTPLQAVLTALINILPRLIMILALLLEFLVNLHFGNWIARSRYLENVVQMLHPGGTGHEAASSLRYILYLTIAVGVVGIIIPFFIQMYFQLQILRTMDDDEGSTNLDLALAIIILQPLMFTPAILMNLFFMFLWLWLCYQR